MARRKFVRGVGFKQTKKPGAVRLKIGRILVPCDDLADAKKSAAYFIKTGAREVEIQELYPSGTWTSTHIVDRNS